MKINTKLVFYFSLAILCTCLTGCGSRDVEVLGGGYEEVTYTRTSFSSPEAHRISLQYRKSDGKRIMIWPSLSGVNSVVTNNIAIFVANKAFEPPRPVEPRATMPRLFAVKSPDLPLDITDEVLLRWSKQSGEDFAKIFKTAGIVYPEEKNNGLEFHFARWVSDLNIFMDWNETLDIMREVKEKGVIRKDRVWHTTYIEKEFKPEVQK